MHLFILCRHFGSWYQGAFSFVGPEHPQVASSSLKLLATVSWREGWCHRLVQLAFHEMLNKVTNFMSCPPPIDVLAVSEATMAYFKVAFQAISEAVDGDLVKGWYISCCR